MNPSDPSQPWLGEIYPSPDSIDVPPAASIRAAFSEPVRINTSSFLLRRNGVAVPGTVTFNNLRLTATFQPTTRLASLARYEVTITTGVVDLAGNALPASTSWSFTTRDADNTSPLMLVTFSPGMGATSVDPTAHVIAVFDHEVLGSTNSIRLAAGSTPVPGYVAYATNPPRATFTADNQLAPNTFYTVTLTSQLTNGNGAPFTGAPVSWTFTTGADTEAPYVTARTPAVGATYVGANPYISVTFNEPVLNVNTTSLKLLHNGALVPAIVTYDASTRTARVQPNQPLSLSYGATFYTVMVTSAITDVGGNTLIPTSWGFDTSGYDTGC